MYKDYQDTIPVASCFHCNREIYEYDIYYYVHGEPCCPDCLTDYEKETRSSYEGWNLKEDYKTQQYGGLNEID